MPGYSVPPLAVVSLIKSNLQDRYESGYPILKELLQNADDARSRRFRLDARSGWPDAGNPLLQGPGLLIVNDGTLTDDDRCGLLSFGESVKAADRAAIGKFGLGQKAVFHLCDAFVVHAVGVDEPFTRVVNPYLGVDVAGNVTSKWEQVSDADEALLNGATEDFQERGLILWLAFRRDELIPAPGAGFSTRRPDSETIVKELARTDHLQVLLTALRHLESIEIRHQGETLCSVRVDGTQERLRGPDDHPPCKRSFHGTIDTGPGDSVRFVGREATIQDGGLGCMRRSDHWPKIINALSSEPGREKGEQHGAATLLRAANDEAQRSELGISWAVFLPISETQSCVLPIEVADLGQFHLLLHGYFFLDSGRRHIEGLDEPANHDEPADDAGLRRAWNTRLRDTVVLPLVPALLKDALDQGMMTAQELTHLTTAIARSCWFKANRTAICKERALVRVLAGPSVPRSRRVAWELASADVELRSLPAILAGNPDLADKLFDALDRWAQERNVKLCIDRSASLTARPMCWTSAELGALFATLSAQAFQSEPLAALLTDLLSEADLNDDVPAVLAPHLVRALRQAMLESPSFAPSAHISDILRHVPRDRLFALPKSVELRRILHTLASSNAAILPVRSEWLKDADHQSPPSEADLNAFLQALAPFVEHEDGRLAEQAAAAALALLNGYQIPELACRREFKDIKIIRARDPLTGSIVVLSFAELLARSRQRFLFRRAPNVESRLHTVVRALPDVQPLVVDAVTDRIHDLTRNVNKEVLFHLIKTTSSFGPEAKRARMITLLSSLEGADEPAVLRLLCAGDAGASAATLWNGDGLPEEIERIIALILEQRKNEFLVPSRIVTELTGAKRKEIPIRDLNMPRLERLIEDGIDALPGLQLSEPERKTLLKTGLRTDLLLRLPIHDRSDGTVGSAQGLYWEDDRWSIPDRLREWVITVRLFDDPEIRSKQKPIISAWSPQAQIEVALSQTEPHRYQEEILDAISELWCDNAAPRTALKESLRTKPWLAADGKAVAPKELLSLPPAVDEEAERQIAGSSRYISVGRLPEGIRAHPGFRYAQEELIRDRRSSIAALAQMIAVAGLQGRLGAAEDFPIDRFTELAEMDADLKLPGWPLLAAVLSSIDDDPDGVRKVAISFHEVPDTEPEKAGRHLDALADVADRDPAQRGAAEQAYRHGFEAVAKWSEDARQYVFGNTRVPTKHGGWRSGREVLAEDNGVASTHVLAHEYKLLLLTRNDVLRVRGIDADNSPDDEESDIEVLGTRSVTQHREFLEGWRGNIPPELVVVYLGVVGWHNESLESYRAEWTGDATMNIDYELDDLGRGRTEPALFLIEKVGGATIEAIALSGDRFLAPLGDHNSMGIVVGNRHKRRKYLFPFRQRTPTRMRIVVMQVRTTDHGVSSVGDRVQVFREFIETAADEVLLDDDAKGTLRRILDRVEKIDQATLEDTERLLRDRLPTLLAALKLPAQSNAHRALRRYEAQEMRASDDDKVSHKRTLWQSICEQTAATEVLAAVRARIRDQGYGGHRVLFELFQNADDAYVQQRESDPDNASFRVDFGAPDGHRLRIAHWGRPINHPGSNVDAGRRRGYDRDLFNMLVMSFSEKRPDEDVTGKFGLGFKCVHLLSDSVGVASGFVAVRTVGGILPEQWPDGLHQAGDLRRHGRTATIIDIPYTTDEMAANGRRTEQAFRDAMTWLPSVARRIRHIEIFGSEPGTIVCNLSSLRRDVSIKVVTIRDARRQTHRALRLDLGDDYCLLLKMGSEGPECFEPAVGRVWNLAPLEENVSSGWLLNGPFPVDPGRGRLAGSIEDRQARFVKLGRALGERLLSLHDLMENDSLVSALDLRIADSDARERFWSRLFDVMSRDLDDDLARHLHAVDRGCGRLVAEHSVLPTHLPEPFDGLVHASSVVRFADKALAGSRILQATRDWRSAGQLKDRIVAADVATQMKKLGFDQLRPITLSKLLRKEMGEDKRIDVTLGTRLGQVITQDAIEKEPLHQERPQILEVASQACFRARDDTWRPVRSLSSKDAGGDDEILLCDFAPDEALLHGDYREESLDFFKAARMRSGYSPRDSLLRKWVDAAHDEHRQRAALRYLVHGRQGPALAKLVRDDRPTWLAEVQTRYTSHELLDDWAYEDRMKLVVELDPSRLEFASSSTYPHSAAPDISVSKILGKLHEWWMTEGKLERQRYAKNVYPEGFGVLSLADTDDRTAWFTMFALACYQLFGRTQDGQHRSFIESGWREGWWVKLAHSEPPGDVRPWLDRLEHWSAPRFDEKYHQWQRTLVDLYTIARGLDVYVELIRRFPQFVEKHCVASLDVVLRPSESLLAQRMGIDAGPIGRTLGIGANWLIRELSRNGVYGSSEARLMAPYCWAPTQRVRTFLTALDPNLDLPTDKEASPAIHCFVVEHIGPDRARFDGDFDLPLQIATRKRHRGRLAEWFKAAGLDTPDFGDESETGNNYA